MWLALDTATDRASVAIGGPGGSFASGTIVGARRHAAALLPAIEACLESVGAGYGDLEGVALADGPGSFTGLRVAATVVRGLIRARPMPLWVAPSLMVCAAGAPPGQTVLSVSNALRGELFAAVYRLGPGVVETLLPPSLLSPQEILRRVPGPLVTVGPAAATLGAQPSWPMAAALLDLVGRAGGARLVPGSERWEPEYGRPAEAQVKWEREHGRPLADSPGPRG
jgi:tRNA threonylcarbamoyladenosine biosynthesis protein TsaB